MNATRFSSLVVPWPTLAGGGLLLLLTAGCPTSSEGIDLTERGAMAMTISRTSESAVATVTAKVSDNSLQSFPYTEIVLADDQVLSVNDVPLTETTQTALGLDATVAATIEAVDEPDTYAISFDNEGAISTYEVTPPEDFDDVTPEDNTEVSRDGFELEWDAPDDNDDATITITITGLTWAYDEDGNLQLVETSVTLEDLLDDGDLEIGNAQLYQFLAGDVSVTLTRVKTVSQKLGFASGTIVLQIDHEISLTLVEPETDEE